MYTIIQDGETVQQYNNVDFAIDHFEADVKRNKRFPFYERMYLIGNDGVPYVVAQDPPITIAEQDTLGIIH